MGLIKFTKSLLKGGILVRRIKLAMLTPDYYPNYYAGIGVHVYSLVENLLSGYNIDITVFVVRCETIIDVEPHIYESPRGVKVYEFFGTKNELNGELDYFTYKWTKNNITAIEYIESLIPEMDFDLLHCHDLFPIWVMDLLRRKLHIPVVSTIHSRFANENEIGDALRGFLCRTANACIAVSHNLANELIERYKISDVQVAYNGVTKSKIFGPVKKENYITFCGRLAKTKGIDILIKAFAILIQNRKYSNMKLVVVGDGDLGDSCKNLVQQLQIGNNVIFKGKVPNSVARTIISKSLIHVVPSIYEPFATVIEEAMMEKTCVIASLVGGAAELIENNLNGILVQPNNIQELARQMQRLLDDPILRNKIEEHALERVMKFEWSSIAAQVYGVYKDVLCAYEEDE